MLTKEQLTTMLTLQDKLNAKINPGWLKAGYPWHRAIMVEGVEALEHYGWKWWKKQEPDLAQARIELVDIWHFILSMRLESCGGDADWAADSLGDTFGNHVTLNSGVSTHMRLDRLIAEAGTGMIHAMSFLGLMKDFELTWDQLYATYIAKNVLNLFRQDHGYRAGSYRKDWGGMEDNAALDQLMKLKPDATPEQLYAKLESVYALVLDAAAVGEKS